MKSIFLFLIFTLYFSFSFSFLGEGEKVYLPQPQKEGGMSLYEALSLRKSERDFDPNKKLNSQIISNALWSCYGVNREKGFKTIPSAKGWYPLIIYVFMEEAVYRYIPEQNVLVKILNGDYRTYTGTQTSVVTSARANFVIIANFKKPSLIDPDEEHKRKVMYMETGHCAFGLSLFAAANHMKGVDRFMVEQGPLLDLLGLNQDEYIFNLAFSLGY